MRSVHGEVISAEYLWISAPLNVLGGENKKLIDNFRAKHDPERSLRTVGLPCGQDEEEKVGATEKPQETHRETHRATAEPTGELQQTHRATAEPRGRNRSATEPKQSRRWKTQLVEGFLALGSLPKDVTGETFEQLHERRHVRRLRKLAAAGDMRAENSAELAALRRKVLGFLQEANDLGTCLVYS